MPREHWFDNILTRYEGALVRYATRITGDLERGRDAVQETFLQLLKEKNPDALLPRIAPWLYTVCRNKALDSRKKEKHMVTGYTSDQVPDERSPATGLEQAQSEHLMLSTIHSLPTQQQEVIRLKFQEGLRYKEIAEITGLSVSNVGVLIHTGLKRVRTEIQKREAGIAAKGGAQ